MIDGKPRPDDTDAALTEPADRPANGRSRARDRGDGGLSFEVPGDADAVECEYCGRPFVAEQYLALHRGLAHAAELSAAERTAFEDARETETNRLRTFRLKALLALVILYFGLLMVYAVAT